MARYRSKPVEVEAFQWNGQPPSEWPQWARDSLDITWGLSSVSVMTNHGPARAGKGDWIVRTEAGESYPIKDEVFQGRYELAE